MSNAFKTPLEKWQDGDISPQEALDALTGHYASVEETLDGWTQQREALREQIESLISSPFAGFDKKVQSNGFEIVTVEPSQNNTYNAKKLDALVVQLMQSGQIELAQRITDCATFSNRKGYIRIARQKK